MNSFVELIGRVRKGDAAAAEELWREYEPLLRREVRLRMRDPRLRQRFDEDDVCQSVMASFFVRASMGQFDLTGPEHLRHLLAQMGRNKLFSQARRHTAERRDCRRGEQLPPNDGGAGREQSSPSQTIALRELLHEFRDRLTEEERQLADLRADNRSWQEIASELGGSADGRRVQLNRAIARVAQELGLEGGDHD
jgi:RNA polymerase sigma-70 factor (ECF subfamily)